MGLVGILCGLEAGALIHLRGWCEIDPGTPYVVLFGGYLATWLVARETRGVARRLALLIGSVVTAFLFDPWHGFIMP